MNSDTDSASLGTHRMWTYLHVLCLVVWGARDRETEGAPPAGNTVLLLLVALSLDIHELTAHIALYSALTACAWI